MELIKKTMDSVIKNNMSAYVVQTKEEVVPLIKTLIKEGDTVAVGGSMSLFDAGVIDFLRCGKYNFLDRYEQGITPDKVRDIYVRSFGADVYFASTNAITEDGKLYNVDGTGNRVAAMIYGPESVILVVGKNKIVKDMNEAVRRVKTVAAPKNCARLGCDTYCNAKNECVSISCGNADYIGDGCKSDKRICCDYVVMAQQRIKDRIKIIFVNEDLGF